LLDADLDGGAIKQRIGRPGQGRSGGFRVLMAYRAKANVVFIYGFAKSERENIDEDELETLRDIAGAWLRADASRLARAVAEGELQEVVDENRKDETQPPDHGTAGNGQGHAQGRRPR
jgi:hypothetical protein